mgnify:FL=1
MPSRSPKQARTMRAAAHDSAFAKRVGIPQSVAREFVAADAQPRSTTMAKAKKPNPFANLKPKSKSDAAPADKAKVKGKTKRK